MTMVLTFILCFAAIGFGQRTTGNIEGTITDQNGAVVPGASVTAKSTGTTAGYNNTVTTNENGYFMFSQVPVGTYTVTATGNGFKTSSGDITVGGANFTASAAPVPLTGGVTINRRPGALPPTGSDPAPIGGLAATLVLAGAALISVAWRRRALLRSSMPT